MNDNQLKDKTNQAVNKLLANKGYVAVVDVLMELGVLTQKDYEDWRRGRVKYLERVVRINLRKINVAVKEIRKEARARNLKLSNTVYNQWGKKKGIRLQFSKNGADHLERVYTEHYVGEKAIKES
jgi:hypothetical protein